MFICKKTPIWHKAIVLSWTVWIFSPSFLFLGNWVSNTIFCKECALKKCWQISTRGTGVWEVVFGPTDLSWFQKLILACLQPIVVMELVRSHIQYCFSNRTRNNILGNVPLTGTVKDRGIWRVIALWVDYDFPLIKSSAAIQSSLQNALKSKVHQ